VFYKRTTTKLCSTFWTDLFLGFREYTFFLREVDKNSL
jgi:hypothetical protein